MRKAWPQKLSFKRRAARLEPREADEGLEARLPVRQGVPGVDEGLPPAADDDEDVQNGPRPVLTTEESWTVGHEAQPQFHGEE